ncbi:30S ribosomal protein S8 [Caldilinea aerophila DSM 14535 = NBRC 104270]|uniref:Small ribosomal subunit protein uS8 n=1 Tax=Caldilinea aerophila (strain DSM 14535 / JCM 11387 / NBRC 104270 / STL-6-O1) TaxID=926550 RepID=I0HZJ8_CALAS|nr:30S ribosomal protein S8 [Caldilinea aerophila DSM 14535 = NBRC 104270]
MGIAQILLQEGFIEGYTVTDEKPQPNLIVRLKYTPQGRSVIRGLERVSRPGRRYYAGFKDIPWVRSGLGINIISTPKGLMTGRRARRERLGGEILCNIW